jgi:hypothetical protein
MRLRVWSVKWNTATGIDPRRIYADNDVQVAHSAEILEATDWRYLGFLSTKIPRRPQQAWTIRPQPVDMKDVPTAASTSLILMTKLCSGSSFGG